MKVESESTARNPARSAASSDVEEWVHVTGTMPACLAWEGSDATASVDLVERLLKIF